ncbi:MAG: pyridoxine 5'-phosphate synthase [Fusobacteria bacterium]|nr:pyridoxine 5'-phosphate synthase [Fusobacteriota bacterium]
MIKLGVNIDHVATLRQARLAIEPNLIRAAVLSEMYGADGITIHLREDRRHIQDNDLIIIRKAITKKLNLELATENNDVLALALDIVPDMATLVPETREEVTTEGGLNVENKTVRLKTENAIEKLKNKGVTISLFVDPKPEVMKIAKELGAEYIEIHTGAYSEAKNCKIRKVELQKIIEAVKSARAMGLNVNAGHGLNYDNVTEIAAIKEIEELNIGHSIVARSVFVGLPAAVKEMKELMINARKNILL